MIYHKRYAPIVFATQVSLLLLLLGFLAIWNIFGSPASIVDQIDLQRIRAERIEKDALILEYRHSIDEQSNAISELQDTLTPWSLAQQGLAKGSTSLNLPLHPPDNILPIIQQSTQSFTPLQIATETIIAHHTPVDPLQVQIIIQNERAYASSMTDVEIAWRDEINLTFQQLFYIKTAITLAVLSIGTCNYIVAVHRISKKKERREIIN